MAGKNSSCEVLCTRKVTEKDIETLVGYIKQDYRMEYIVDNLPGATVMAAPNAHSDEFIYEVGFPLGFYDEQAKQANLYNHVFLKLFYRHTKEDSIEDKSFVIVGFEIVPASFKPKEDKCVSSVEETRALFKLNDDVHQITYSYSVQWIEDRSRVCFNSA